MAWFEVGSGSRRAKPERAQRFVQADRVVVEAFADDFAAALQAATGRSDRELPWIAVWQYLSEHLKDDEGTPPGATNGFRRMS